MARRLISSGSTFEKLAGYSRAVVDGEFCFVSGTTGYDYSKMAISPDVAEQTEQCFANIRKALSQAHRGDIVQLKGLLVNVIASDKHGRTSTWNTSLSRADGGNGACEIVYITSFRLNNRIYE